MGFEKVGNGPFAAGDHMVQKPANWMSQCAICSPLWRFLYHVISSCKRPIRAALPHFCDKSQRQNTNQPVR